jgi:hypothetical protein
MATNKIFIPYYISSNTGAPAQVLPRVFFYNGLKESDPYWIQHWTTSSFGKTVIAQQYESFPYFDNYSGQETTTSSLSLLFLNEDVAYGNSVPSQSLYDLYWAKYVDLLYNPRTRIIRLSAVLPFPVYQKLELNDVIQLRSNYYHLRAINDYNLKTGECRMELLGPLLEGSLNNTFTFDNTCEQAPTLYGSVINDTGSRQITFAITGSNCCNNPNYVTVKAEFGTGSCPQTASLTSYVTLPNSYPIVVNYASLLAGYPTVNCVTMSVANLCYGIPVTGSYLTFFTGPLSGSYGNVAISASTQKNNCGVCQTGSFYTTTVAAGTYISTASQANADNQAVAFLTSVSQSNANSFGSCSINTYYNTQLSASVQRNDCGPCGTGSFVLYTVPASSSMFTNTCSLSEAQTSASIYFAATSQSYANTNGTCSFTTFYSLPISASVQKNDCTGSLTGSYSWVSVPASQSNSTCSLADANNKAQIYFNANSQSWANESGYCYNISRSFTLINNNIDIDDNTTSSIFPLTASLIVTSSNQNIGESDSRWKQVGWYSQSYATVAIDGIYGWISSSADTMYVKIRTKNNGFVNTAGAGGGAQYIITHSVQPPASNYFYFIDGGRIVKNNLTSSIATSSLAINFRNPNVSKTITASYIYTTSSTFPNITSSDWIVWGYSYSGSFSISNRDFFYSASTSGSPYSPDGGLSKKDSYYGGGGYIYVKMQSGSTTQPIAIATVNDSFGTTLTASFSGSYVPNGDQMVRLEINQATQSDANYIVINLNTP